jgi:hypothetical protein
MKKLLLVLIAVIGISFAANAQNNAIGLRLGWGNEISYQTAMGANRLELDFGRLDDILYNNDWYFLSLAGTYQWTFDLPVNGLGWYAGLGALGGMYLSDIDDAAGLTIGIGGIIGIDYQFSSLPIQISLDARPMYAVIHPKHHKPGLYSAAFGIRYMF